MPRIPIHRVPSNPPSPTTLQGIAQSLPMVKMDPLPAPDYTTDKPYDLRPKAALAVESMRYHTTDEGWQLLYGLGLSGYELCGYNLTVNETNVPIILDRLNPGVVVMQDKREWDTLPNDFREHRARFTGVTHLRDRDDIFKITILKDAHQRPKYHANSAEEMGVHAWITYYATPVVKRLAPYVRQEHILRTYHTVDSKLIPEYTAKGRNGCLLSGAVSGVYPLRLRLFKQSDRLPDTKVLKHPGYHRKGTATPDYLKLLSRYRVAICTCSIYGYSLRKLIEATACGCVVITNLPVDEYLPDIDGNLVRVSSDISTEDMARVVATQIKEYDAEQQRHYAELCKVRYDFRFETMVLAGQIEELRTRYKGTL